MDFQWALTHTDKNLSLGNIWLARRQHAAQRSEMARLSKENRDVHSKSEHCTHVSLRPRRSGKATKYKRAGGDTAIVYDMTLDEALSYFFLLQTVNQTVDKKLTHNNKIKNIGAGCPVVLSLRRRFADAGRG